MLQTDGSNGTRSDFTLTPNLDEVVHVQSLRTTTQVSKVTKNGGLSEDPAVVAAESTFGKLQETCTVKEKAITTEEGSKQGRKAEENEVLGSEDEEETDDEIDEGEEDDQDLDDEEEELEEEELEDEDAEDGDEGDEDSEDEPEEEEEIEQEDDEEEDDEEYDKNHHEEEEEQQQQPPKKKQK